MVLAQAFVSREINPQDDSPLYNRVPAEIRTAIFQFAVTELQVTGTNHTTHDFAVRFDHEPVPLPDIPSLQRRGQLGHSNSADRWRTDRDWRDHAPGFDWCRPDCPYPRVICTNLLRTCKRIYLETHHLPLEQQGYYVLYCGRGPPGRPRSPSYYPGALPQSVRFFAQVYFLQDGNPGFWSTTISQPLFQQIETLRITLRRTDYWDWEFNGGLVINPYSNNRWSHSMLHAMHEMEKGRTVRCQPEAWTVHFQRLPNLKTLIMDFETSEFRKEEMEWIVSWAMKWKFPLPSSTTGAESTSRHLSADKNPVEKMSWRGAEYHWSNYCEVCNGRDRQCTKCPERAMLSSAGYGPRLLVWTVTWKAVEGDWAAGETHDESASGSESTSYSG